MEVFNITSRCTLFESQSSAFFSVNCPSQKPVKAVWTCQIMLATEPCADAPWLCLLRSFCQNMTLRELWDPLEPRMSLELKFNSLKVGTLLPQPMV